MSYDLIISMSNSCGEQFSKLMMLYLEGNDFFDDVDIRQACESILRDFHVTSASEMKGRTIHVK